MMQTQYHLICDGDPRCGFRVGQRYFEDKLKFQAGICPNCNSPILIVGAFTMIRVPGASMVTDRDEPNYGAVVVARSSE